MPLAELTDARCYYELHGSSGSPVILIPGLGTTCELWSSVTSELSRSFSLILLDNRTWKDPYDLATEQDMLGPEQWAWLERILRTTAAVARSFNVDVMTPCGVTNRYSLAVRCFKSCAGSLPDSLPLHGTPHPWPLSQSR